MGRSTATDEHDTGYRRTPDGDILRSRLKPDDRRRRAMELKDVATKGAAVLGALTVAASMMAVVFATLVLIPVLWLVALRSWTF
jgi:hypothetical protein